MLIVGAGPIGLMHMQLAKIAGAKEVIVSEPNEMRREVALELGADKVVDPTTEDLPQIISEATNGMGSRCDRDGNRSSCTGKFNIETVQKRWNSQSVCRICRYRRMYD